jgi:hypothetical protein
LSVTPKPTSLVGFNDADRIQLVVGQLVGFNDADKG